MITTDEYREKVDNCLRSNRLLGSMSQDEGKAIVEELQYPDNYIDLYQYRRCNVFSFNDFLKNQITLVHPKYFNDIFEVMPYFNLREFVQIYEKYDVKTAKKYFDIAKERDFTPSEIQEIGSKNAATLLTLEARLLRDHGYEGQYYESFEKIQDNGLMQMAQPINQVCRSKQEQTRIACFSEEYDSPMMWGHYADSNRGFCVKHRLPVFLNMKLCPKNGREQCDNSGSCVEGSCVENGCHWLLPVIYCSERPDLISNLAEEISQTIFQRMGFTPELDKIDLLAPLKFSCYKSINWKYEREWRWIRTHCTEAIPEYASISVGAITGLYLGERISKEHENILKDYASFYKMPDGNNIPVYKMRSSFTTPEYRLLADRIA